MPIAWRGPHASLALIVVLVLLAACGDGGPADPGDDTPAASRLEIVAPGSVTEGVEFELTVTARTEAGQVDGDFSGSVTLSVTGGTIDPSSLSLSAGSGTSVVQVDGVTGLLTLSARSGGLAGSAEIELLPPLDRLVGDAGDPASPAIPALEYRVEEEDFTTGHPDLPGLPMAEDILILSFRLGTTVGEVNDLLQDLDAEIVGGLPGLAGEVPGILMLRVPTGSHAEMEALLETVRADPIVETALQDVALGPDLVTRSNGGQPAGWEWASLAFGGNWGIKRSRVPQLWNLNAGMRKAIAAGSAQASGTLVMDAVFAPTHPDVAYSNLTPARVGAHGTNVAGIIGATHDNQVGIDGVNPFAVLTAFATQSLGTLISDYSTQVIANPTIRIVNVSMGYNWYLHTPPVNPDVDPAAQATASRSGTLFNLSQRIVAASRPLPVLVTTAGNSGRRNARFNSPQANAALEHGDANIIVVEALTNDPNAPGGLVLATYSDINGHLSAPGSAILTTADSAQLDGYSTGFGTSLAAPHVSGLAGYLYTLDPAMPDPTATSNPMRDVLLGSSIPLPGGSAPRIDAYAAAHQVGGLRTLRMLTDIDDGTPDGNLRIDPGSGAAFLETDADGDGGPGDGQVDMSDFRRWRDGHLYLDGSPDVRLDGAADHPKKDLNGSGDVDFLLEFIFPFVDLNGDLDVDPATTAYVPGVIDADVTDLQVLQYLFDDHHYIAPDLDGLLESADLALRPARIQGAGAVQISSSVTAPGANTPWQERVHSGLEADGEGLHQIYTVPVGSPGETWTARVVGRDGAGETLFDVEQAFAVHPGEDHFWDPEPSTDPAPKLLWTFDADLDGWTVEDRPDDSPWGRVGWNEREGGVVVFDGVGYDGSPNGLIYQQVDLPTDVTLLRYVSSAHDRGDGAASLRVRLVPEGSPSVTIQDWQELATGPPGFDFIEATIDISAWAGQRVTLYFEHADIDGGGNNQRWLDEIEVVR
ncbi:MAG TPA: S8 family serine peptidase [Longimicrobiales bacterium]|nr:S8 family serine peptidase [Longimicrobiales bacterium]